MLSCQKSLFSLPQDLAYLNGAYMSPSLKRQEEVAQQELVRLRNPTSIDPNDFFSISDRVREKFAQLIEVDTPQRIAIIPSVSYGMASIANNITLKAEDEIVLMGEQFPSNVYAWQTLAQKYQAKIVTVDAPNTLEGRAPQWNTRILEQINLNTRLVAMAHVHWADGTLFDLKTIRQRAHEVGALLVVDGTQSIGALPFSIAEIQPDALICAAYKWLMGPYGTGFLYIGEQFEGGTPIEDNWKNRLGSEDFSALVNYQSEYKPFAARYEMGEPAHFVGLPMMEVALDQLHAWGVEQIQDYCKNLIVEPFAELRAKGYWVEEEGGRGNHLWGIRSEKGLAVQQIKERLRQNNVSVSVRGDAIRVSPHVYNDALDMEKLLDALSVL